MEHILCLFFPQMVDEQDGDAMFVRQPLEHRQVPVVVGVGGIVDWADHLQGVDDDQHGVRVSGEKCFYLFLQPLANEGTLGTEVDTAWCVLGDLKQPVLNAEDGIFQTEIESGALPGGHVPHRFSLGHCHGQPQSQPGFAHLRGARQDVQALCKQGIHHKIGQVQWLAHQGCSIHCAERCVVFSHGQFLLILNMKSAHLSERFRERYFSFHLIILGVLIK